MATYYFGYRYEYSFSLNRDMITLVPSDSSTHTLYKTTAKMILKFHRARGIYDRYSISLVNTISRK